MNEIIGIYKITCLANYHFYIGQSRNFESRKLTHFRSLKNNKHANPRLQNVFNKYGFESLKFEIIEYCELEKLNNIEQFYLDLYFESDLCMNLNPLARKPPARKGKSSPTKGKPLSSEHRLKLSLSHMGNKWTEAQKNKYMKSMITCRKPVTEYQKQCLSERKAVSFKVTNPNGEIIESKNIRKFCVENNLDCWGFSRLLRGHSKLYKGWTLP